MAVKLNDKYLKQFVGENEYKGIVSAVEAAHKTLGEKSGLGNDFLGWVTLPSDYDKGEFERIKKAAEKIKKDSEVLIVIGIGGSYLGARAAIEALKSTLYNSLKKDTPEIYFVGNSISPTYLSEVISLVEGRDFSVNVISKSGTTTEPALAFRVFREMLEQKYGADGAKGRIYATTDKARGTLKELSDRNGYETFVIPDDVGGRYSVLTAVGLLPIACAGCDIDALMNGAKAAQEELCDPDIEKNDCYKYAAARNILYRKGFKAEMLVAYENSFSAKARARTGRVFTPPPPPSPPIFTRWVSSFRTVPRYCLRRWYSLKSLRRTFSLRTTPKTATDSTSFPDRICLSLTARPLRALFWLTPRAEFPIWCLRCRSLTNSSWAI